MKLVVAALAAILDSSFVVAMADPANRPSPPIVCDIDSNDRCSSFVDRLYLVETARAGWTMRLQGPVLAIGRLHPEFVKRLAQAIRAARKAGLVEAGIFSAYRPPAFGVGGFADKFNSLHSYGLAVDMVGIGGAGSTESRLWHEIAAQHGIVCPYGHGHRAEWNHCQATPLEIVRHESPLRDTITADGPTNLQHMFEVGSGFIPTIETLPASTVEYRPLPFTTENRNSASRSSPKGAQSTKRAFADKARALPKGQMFRLAEVRYRISGGTLRSSSVQKIGNVGIRGRYVKGGRRIMDERAKMARLRVAETMRRSKF